MQLDQATINAIVAGIFGAGVCSIIVQLIKRPTEKKGVEIAHEKFLLEEDMAKRKEEADEREEERKRRAELREDLKRCEDRADALQAQLDRVRVERDEARMERDEARAGKRETEQLLATRLYQCEKAGLKCQPKQQPPEESA